jgi:hypothetical protein
VSGAGVAPDAVCWCSGFVLLLISRKGMKNPSMRGTGRGLGLGQ